MKHMDQIFIMPKYSMRTWHLTGINGLKRNIDFTSFTDFILKIGDSGINVRL